MVKNLKTTPVKQYSQPHVVIVEKQLSKCQLTSAC